MKNKKIDGVIETIRYDEMGKLSLIRLYERRGSTFSDRILFSRDQLIQKLRNGKKFHVGKRIRLQASTFELGKPVFLSGNAGEEFIVTQTDRPNCDNLPDAPLF